MLVILKSTWGLRTSSHIGNSREVTRRKIYELSCVKSPDFTVTQIQGASAASRSVLSPGGSKLLVRGVLRAAFLRTLVPVPGREIRRVLDISFPGVMCGKWGAAGNNVRAVANATIKSADMAGSRGTTTDPRGIERAGATAKAARTSVAKRDACIACHRIKVYGYARSEKAQLRG